MNQLREWDGNCQRCMIEVDAYTMSLYDVRLICADCAKVEQKRYKIEKNKHNTKKK